jgi:hypothetical protein
MGYGSQPMFAWYLDITPNEMFSFGDYPIADKRGIPMCQEHGKQLEMKKVVVLDQVATEMISQAHTTSPTHIPYECIERCIAPGKYK